ncbi:hypothetical protein RRG08_027055 [Elysia crispata]|uniref:Uncharacterized protein n=1 Tax=Elysia crispata TaxID=231223 RepID=A0AAE1DH15_9GAST|nr:hypothetical protein RRG08_027055 [Elysia crispata]
MSTPSRRKCVTSPDSFCYVCGSFMAPKQKRNISDFVKRAYFSYFKMKLGDQDKTWAPHKVCHSCEESLRQWTKGKDKISFSIPMVWREPRDHITDCYFCLTCVSGFSTKSRHLIQYPNLDSAIRPVLYADDDKGLYSLNSHHLNLMVRVVMFMMWQSSPPKEILIQILNSCQLNCKRLAKQSLMT